MVWRKLFQNQPSEYTENFKRERCRSNFKIVYYVLVTVLPVSFFMLLLSILIQDQSSVIIANSLLAAFSVLIFIGFKVIERMKIDFPNLPSLFVTHMTYIIILFWGIHMMGYNLKKLLM